MTEMIFNSAEDKALIVDLTAQVVGYAFMHATRVPTAEEAGALIGAVGGALRALQGAEITAPTIDEPKADKPTNAQIKKSITPDAIISFIDNKPYKTLKRHLGRHDMDMAKYRERYGLPADYPSVAPNYSAARSEMAKKIGLGARGKGAAAPK